MNICIYGASSTTLAKHYIEAVETLGKRMAQRGHGLVFGGGANGLMGAAVRGVTEQGGFSLGIAPTFFDKPGILFENCSEFIFTETMRERKQILEDRSDAFIMVPGGIGTFEEFFEVLTLRQLGQHTKPIAVYNVGGYYDHFEAMMQHAFDEGFMKEGHHNIYKIFDDADELLDYIEKEALSPFIVSELKY